MALNLTTLQSLTNLLIHLIDSQTTLESIKWIIDISQENQYSLFKQIDEKQKGQLDQTDLQQFFIRQDVRMENEQIAILFKLVDRNKDGWITFNEFQQIFQKNTNLTYPSTTQDKAYSFITIFIRLCFQLIQTYQLTSTLCIKLNTSFDFSVSKCFEIIDIQKTGYITIKNLAAFLRLMSRPRLEKELIPLINIAGNQGEIEYKEFANLITGRNLQVDQLQQTNNASQVQSRQQASTSQETKISSISSQIKKNILSSPSSVPIQQFIQPEQQQKIESKFTEAVIPTQQTTTFPQPLKQPQLSASQQMSQDSQSHTYPLSASDMKEFIQMLSKLIDWDRELQSFKISLSQCSDFNLLDAFRYFDTNQNEQISKSELEVGLNKLGVFPTETELYLFFQSYDRDMDSFIQFGEFSQIFYSADEDQVDLLNKHAPNFTKSAIKTIFSFDTRMRFKSILVKLLETEVLLNNYRIQLSSRNNFNLKSAFNSLDISHDGIISYEDLKEVLNRFSVQTSEYDMINLFRRFDRNLDGEIHYEEFVQEMSAKR